MSFKLDFFLLFRQDKLSQLEKERELSNSAFSEEERRKENIISDLSDQLKESEERIQVNKKYNFCYIFFVQKFTKLKNPLEPIEFERRKMSIN